MRRPPLAAIHYQAVPGNSLATHQSAVELKNSRLAYFHDVAAVSLVCVGVPGLATLSALQTVHTLLSRPWLTRLNCSLLNKVRRYWREHVCSQPAKQQRLYPVQMAEIPGGMTASGFYHTIQRRNKWLLLQRESVQYLRNLY